MNNLQLPGPFVVFQGIPGDGICNTLLQQDDEEYFEEEEDEDENNDDDDSLLYACQNDSGDKNNDAQTMEVLLSSSPHHHHHHHFSTTQTAAACQSPFQDATTIHRLSIRSPTAAAAAAANATTTTTNNAAPSTTATTTTTTTTFLGQGFTSMNPAAAAAAVASSFSTLSAPSTPGASTTASGGGTGTGTGTLRRRFTAPAPTTTTTASDDSATIAAAAVRPTILPPMMINNSTDQTAAFLDMETASLVTTAARIAAAVASSSTVSQQQQQQQQQQQGASSTNHVDGENDDEDFVVVNDGSTTTTTSNMIASSTTAPSSSSSEMSIRQTMATTAAAAAPPTSSSSTANTVTASSSLSSILQQACLHHQESLRQQQPQHQPQHQPSQPDTANETRTRSKMIQLWKTASRTRVAHLHREWFSNCQATAPNLTTMDIQPWIIQSRHRRHIGGDGGDDDDDNDDAKQAYELAVFDRLPTNTTLLQNFNNKVNNNNTARPHHLGVVLPTAKIVGSLAPGMAVVGTAITTFEVVIPNHPYSSRKNNNNNNNSATSIDCSHPQQSQAPACLVMANALDAAAASSRLEFCQHETFYGNNNNNGSSGGGGPLLVPQQGRLQFLHLQSSSPTAQQGERVVLYSIHGYTVLGAGLSSVYAQPDVWYWKVTCPVGAYVREGLDLTTHLKEVLPYGTVCQVQRKTVNAHGLARLSIRAILPLDADIGNGGDDQDDQDAADTMDSRSRYNSAASSLTAAAAAATLAPTITATTSSSSLTRRSNSTSSSNSNSSTGGERRQRARTRQLYQQRPQRDSPCRLVEGWCSQFLNPMSGQGGSVVQPIPFCVPVVYRITLPEGAVVRQEIELTSPQIGHIPYGAVVTVTERAFSEFPTDKCIERLRLAPGSSFCNGAGAGWISIRLNKKSPEDRLIVQYVGLDTSFDPEQAGIFHFQQACAANALATSTITSTELQPQHSALVDHARLRQGAASQHQFSHQHQVSTTPTIHEISSIDENESRSSLSSAGGGGFGSGMTLPVTTTTTFAATVATTDPHHQQQHPPLPTKINKNDHHRRRRRPDTPDNSCLICIDKTRNATMVHGDTGHIACCLDCARMLKASGQPCPVCRLPIDLVILHYWA